jgi:hypothetical protein
VTGAGFSFVTCAHGIHTANLLQAVTAFADFLELATCGVLAHSSKVGDSELVQTVFSPKANVVVRDTTARVTKLDTATLPASQLLLGIAEFAGSGG